MRLRINQANNISEEIQETIICPVLNEIVLSRIQYSEELLRSKLHMRAEQNKKKNGHC